MDSLSVRLMARNLLDSNGLTDWTFRFNTNTTRVGVCKYGPQRIEISERFTKTMTEAQVRNVITHEVAHALVGYGHGHDATWARTHRSLGGDGKRCQSVSLDKSEYKYRLVDRVDGRVLGHANRKGHRLAASVCTCHREFPLWIEQR